MRQAGSGVFSCGLMCNLGIDDPTSVVLVGDTYEADYIGARVAGMRALFLSRNGSPEDRVPPSSVISTLKDVVKYTDGVDQAGIGLKRELHNR